MHKKKIYLDTSVISYLRQEDAPAQMADTLECWEILKRGKYDVYISDVTANELGKCPEPKRSELLALLNEVQYNEVEATDNIDVNAIAAEILRHEILPPSSVNDRLHIAAAIFCGCNIIVSWNFKHFVNVKTIEGVRVIAMLNGLPPVDIYSPTVLLERRNTDG